MNYNNRKSTPGNDTTGDMISWVIIFILLFVFPPVGLLLLIRKMRSYAKPSAKNFRQVYSHSGDYAHQNSYSAGYSAQKGSYSSGNSAQQGAYSTGSSSQQGAYSTGSSSQQGAYSTGSSSQQSAHSAGNSSQQGAYSAGNSSQQGAYSAGNSSQQGAYSAGNTARQAARAVGDAARQAAYTAADSARQAVYTAGDAARQAIRASGDAARSAVQAAGDAARQAAGTAGSGSHQVNSQNPAYGKQPAQGVHNNSAYTYSKPLKTKNKKRNRLEKKSGKFLSTILLLASIAMLIIGVTRFPGAIQEVVNYGTDLFDLIMSSCFLVGGLVTFFTRNIGVRRISRYKNHFSFIADRGIVPIADIAKAAGVSVKTANRDIQAMIDNGYLEKGAYIDNELDSLVLYPEAAKEAREAARAASAASTASPAQNVPTDPEGIPVNPYMAIIAELRELNLTITDIPISDKIDRIEETTAKIFRIVEENPEKQPQIRRFMSYYLPTTLKLLHSYATLEKQGIKGENITSAKENIGRILDTLATGFEQQLDQLFKSDAIDIAADITVLENLMQQDGLTNDKPELKVMESNGSIW